MIIIPTTAKPSSDRFNGVTTDFSTDANINTVTDWFGRVTGKSLDIDIVSDDGNFSLDSEISLTYADTDTTASTKVTSLTSSVTNGTATVSEQEHYEYDSVGNITGIYKIEENQKVYYNRYYYDEANQIIREDNRLGEFTSVYTYDVGGNIVSRIRYPYTEGEITGLTATETHTYSYDNATWGDVLTGYNGQPVTYDAMGNITSLNGDTYTWTAGRQLSRITKADNSYIDYFYDDNGQLAMYKMYEADGSLDGGAEYFWDSTKLIAVKLIESESDTDGMSAFMRIIYDTNDEPLGFLLNDAMPFLYTKNILGDITGVVYYENANYLFRYAYDAYGNYELISPDDSAAAEIMATIFHSLNPLTYRGYIFTPAIGISHYLGSRFYVPQLCRFMNADIYADTAQGAVGTNMFAYCNNNPVMFIDPEGTFSITATGIKITSVFVLLYVVACVVVLLPIFTNGTITVSISDAINETMRTIQAAPARIAMYVATVIAFLFASMSYSSAQSFLVSAASAAAPLPPDKGGKGIKTTSTTLYDKNGIRIDVENPGGRKGQIHMHYKGGKYFYHVSQQKFVLENGDLASKSIQELLNNEAVVKAIAKGLAYLGY